jgi:hypothetical protein
LSLQSMTWADRSEPQPPYVQLLYRLWRRLTIPSGVRFSHRWQSLLCDVPDSRFEPDFACLSTCQSEGAALNPKKPTVRIYDDNSVNINTAISESVVTDNSVIRNLVTSRSSEIDSSDCPLQLIRSTKDRGRGVPGS